MAEEIQKITKETEKEIGQEAHHLAHRAQKQVPVNPEIAYRAPQPKPLSVPKQERDLAAPLQQQPPHVEKQEHLSSLPKIDDIPSIPKEKHRFDPSKIKLPHIPTQDEKESPAKDQLAMMKSLEKFDLQKKKGAQMSHMAELARAKFKSAEVAE